MPQKDFNLTMTFGDDSYEDTAFNLNLDIQLNEQKALEKKKGLRIKQQKPNDVYINFQFCVVQGRQKQAIQYLRKGIDQPGQNNNFNPVQNLLFKPKSSGKVTFFQQPGLVILSYCFYDQYVFNILPQVTQTILNQSKQKKFTPKVHFDLLIKGEQNLNNKQKTTIYANYLKLKIQGQNLSPKDLYNILNSSQLLNQQFLDNPTAKMMTFGFKRAELNFRLNNLRRIIQMYNQAAQMNNSDQKASKYWCKSLLKNKINIYLITQNLIYGQGSVQFKSQVTLNRVLKLIIKTFQSVASNFN